MAKTQTFSARTTTAQIALIDAWCAHFEASRSDFFARAAQHELEWHARDRFTVLADYLVDRFGGGASLTVGGSVVTVGNDDESIALVDGHLPEEAGAPLPFQVRALHGTATDPLRDVTVEQTLVVLDDAPGPTGGLPVAFVGQHDTDYLDVGALRIKARKLPRNVVLADPDGVPFDPTTL